MVQNIVKFLVRSGPDADRKLTLLQQGELGYTTDINAQRLFVGDGATMGGTPVASRFFHVPDWVSDPATLSYVQLNDILFVRSTTSLFALTSTNLTPTSANYMQIAQL